MTLRTLVKRSLRFHWRSHLGVVIGAAIGSAALIGALIVGDSVKGSLRERALERLGHCSFLLYSPDYLFKNDLPHRIRSLSNMRALQHSWSLYQKASTELPTVINPDKPERSLLLVVGTAAREDGTRRLNRIQVIGVSDFTPVLLPPSDTAHPNRLRDTELTNECVINLTVATGLGLKAGDTIVLRIAKSTSLSPESAISTKGGQSVAIRFEIHAVSTNGEIANFTAAVSAFAPANVFIPQRELATALGLSVEAEAIPANALLSPEVVKLVPSTRPAQSKFGGTLDKWLRWLRARLGYSSERGGVPKILVDQRQQMAELSTLLAEAWSFDSFQIADWRAGQAYLELRTPRVFLDPPLVRSALAADTNAHSILTYLANLITVGSNATPYSMVTAAGAPWTPPDLRDDEIVLNQWLADDLRAKPGDALTLVYFDPESGARLTERTNTFRVHSIVPMQMPWADRTLMPQFPGIEKAETTAEWDTAFPLVHKIRPQDDAYWTDHRGTPKAFITLAAGQKMWANRFGNLTAIRFPIPTNLVMVGDEVTSLHSAGGTASPPPLTPALSPSEGERENRPPSPSKSKPADSSTADRKTAGEQSLSPLPGGEGQGEGGRSTNSAEIFRAALEKKILATLKPEELGLRFEPVREQALKAAEQSQDFGGLFIGFSLFVIVAALLLMAMLFQFSLEQRATEIGTLLAVGFTPKQVRRLFLREGAALAFIGGIIGTLGGIGYARAMLHGLTTIWRDAVGASALKFFVTPQTLAIGLFASTFVAVFTLWFALRKQARQPARELLTGDSATGETWWGERPREPRQQTSPSAPAREDARPTSRSKLGWLALVTALILVGWMLAIGDSANAGAFFGAGALVLIGGLTFVNARLRQRPSLVVPALAGPPNHPRLPPDRLKPGLRTSNLSLTALALRGLTRRRSRSVATAAMLASSTFLIVSIGVFRLDANRDATQRTSGTGGFALIGESTMPVVADLNTKAGRETFALDEKDFTGVNVVHFRVRAGDEASCLNLNRAQNPRLLGVKPETMAGRFTTAKGTAWSSLGRRRREESLTETGKSSERLLTSSPTMRSEVAAIGDAASIQWAMGKKVGDTLDYVDERGQPFKVRIVGAVANSILQGQLIIDEAEFVKRFPSESGYKYFLIDAPTNRVADVSAKLSRALQDVGLELTPAPQRLAQFNAVQNTYLGTFQILGGLGLLLGSAGLGIVVLRNVLERRGELAVLLAVGWRRSAVNQLVLHEHLALLGLGLTVGLVAAVVAVLPSLLTPGAEFPWFTLSLTLAAVLANGVLWTWLATRVALRGELLSALRGE